MTSFARPNAGYAIKAGYRTGRDVPAYVARPDGQVSHQPDVYALAAHLGSRFGCTHVIDIGCGAGDKLAAMHPQFHVIGVDRPSIVSPCARAYAAGQWIGHDLEEPRALDLDPAIVGRSVVICADVIEHLAVPDHLLELLHGLLEHAPVALLSTPERDLVRGSADCGPPHNPYHVREWNLEEFAHLLRGSGFDVEFLGLTINNSLDRQKRTILAVLANHARPQRCPAPPDYRVVAIVKTFNEADVIGPMVRRLTEGGVDVYLIDNWSTDGTLDIARQAAGHGLVGLEQFPPGGRSHGTYQWIPLLARTEEVASTIAADWYIHHDADEYRESPWPGVDLRDGLYHVAQCGFNAVDFTVVNFHPVDDGFTQGVDPVAHFRHWDFGLRPGHFQQVKAWKRTAARVGLVASGGHLATFPGRRIFPYKFLLRHYPFRTQTQAIRKVHDDRIPHETERGIMHGHYDQLRAQPCFIRERGGLPVFDDDFYRHNLCERLAGVGIVRTSCGLPRAADTRLCTTPNQHARPPRLSLTASSASFSGYQDYVLTRHGLHVMPVDGSLARKHDLLKPVLAPSLVAGRTVLDLGANSAFFSFLALQEGAAGATAVDLDAAYVAQVAHAARALGFDGLSVAHANISDWREPADVVIALALVHWLYNCTSAFGTVGAVVRHLAGLARHALIVEWVEPDDPMVTFFGHLEWTGDAPAGPYTRKAFERELASHFARLETIGDVSATRRLYVARKQPSPIDLRCPLPLRHPVETVVSCSRLTTHRGVEFWSRVYDLQDRVEKQTSGALAAREGRVLQRLAGAAVPGVMEITEAGGQSIVTLEKIGGEPFDVAAPALAASATAWRTFVDGCLDLLVDLADAAVEHRDIHRDNVLVREGRPVLIDFGWATAPGLPVFTPEGFAPRLNSSDVHAMGVMLEGAGRRAGQAVPVVMMMTNDDPEFRIDDPHLLRALAALLHPSPCDAGDVTGSRSDTDARTLVATLVDLVQRRDRTMLALHERVGLLEEQVAAQRRTLMSTELALADAERSLNLRASPADLADLHVRLAALASDTVIPPFALDVTSALRPHALAYASALRARGQPLQAWRVATALIEQADPSEDVQEWLVASYMAASLCAELGKHDDALEGFARILRLDPSRVSPGFRGGALFHSAMVLKAQGALAAAHDHLERCLEVLPNHGAARAALAGSGG